MYVVSTIELCFFFKLIIIKTSIYLRYSSIVLIIQDPKGM